MMVNKHFSKQDLIAAAEAFAADSSGNYVSAEAAIAPDLAGMRIFDAPKLAFGSPEDALFLSLKEPKAIGEHFLLPKEWLPQTQTVISVFLPFTETIRQGNARDHDWPSPEWLHGRIEGQAFVSQMARHLVELLAGAGYESLTPTLDPRFWSNTSDPRKLNPGNQDPAPLYTSNWSERHIAFVCGHGTFGLSKGLITKYGVAGRFVSIVTALSLKPDQRDYQGIYEYCTFCGDCIKNCPVNAIDLAKGKSHLLCSEFLDLTAEKYKPRYGCGKCQVDVACQSRRPKRALRRRDRSHPGA